MVCAFQKLLTVSLLCQQHNLINNESFFLLEVPTLKDSTECSDLHIKREGGGTSAFHVKPNFVLITSSHYLVPKHLAKVKAMVN